MYLRFPVILLAADDSPYASISKCAEREGPNHQKGYQAKWRLSDLAMILVENVKYSEIVKNRRGITKNAFESIVGKP